jgi:hypothetical protein
MALPPANNSALAPSPGSVPYSGLAPGVPGLPYGLNPSVAAPAANTSTSSSTSSSSSSGTVTPILPTGPYPDRVLPSWLPRSADSLTGELAAEYANVPKAYDTSAVDAASAQQQQRDLTTGLRAAGNAASEYTARTTQQGGSAAGAGLIRAEGQIGALNAAGQAKVEAAKYDVQQREAAAGQAAQIASTLSDLRTGYLKTLTGYAASEDAAATGQQSNETSSSVQNQVATSPSGSGGGGGSGGTGNYSIIPNAMGLGSGLNPVSYNADSGSVSYPENNSAATFGNWVPGT